jgi:hypothetical protein
MSLQKVWVIERKVNGRWVPSLVYIKRDNARHHCAMNKLKFGAPEYRVVKYVCQERIRVRNPAKTNQKAPGAEITVWPTVGTHWTQRLVKKAENEA